jgi:hypothetical protein
MGIEYRIRFSHPDPLTIAERLRKLNNIAEDAAGVFTFHEDSARRDMPDATAQIQSDGIYFCDNGGSGRKFLGIMLAAVVDSFGPTTIEEL